MSGERLEMNYAPLPAPMSGKRTAAWISLLVLGILTIGVGVLSGAGAVLMGILFNDATRPQGEGATWALIGVGSAVFFIEVGSAIVETVCGLKLRRGSRRAGVWAAIVVGFQIMLVVGVVAMGIVLSMLPGARVDIQGMVIGIVFYGLVAAVLSMVEWLVVRAIRELKAEPAAVS